MNTTLKSLLLCIIERDVRSLDNYVGLADFLMEQEHPLGTMIANCIEIIRLERRIDGLKGENKKIVNDYDPKCEKLNRAEFINCISLVKKDTGVREVFGSGVMANDVWWLLTPSGCLCRSVGKERFRSKECPVTTADEDTLLRILTHYAWVAARC